MQASLPVTPQTPAATPTVMPGQAPAVGGSRVVPAAPQFDAAIVKAMANTAVKATTATATADQPAVPAAQPVANQPTVLPPAPATPTPAVPQALPLPQVLQLSQALPLPLPDPSVVTGPVPPAVGRSATAATRKGTATDRQPLAQTGPPSQVAPAALPLFQGVPLTPPPTDPGTPQQPEAPARPSVAAIEVVSAAARKPGDSILSHLAAPSPAEPLSTIPDGPSPPAHDAIAAAGNAPSAQPASQVAAEPSLTSLPANTVLPAPVPSAPTPPDSPRPTVASPAGQVAPVLVSMARAPDGTQQLTLRLDPPELGHLQIRVERPPDAPAHVDITVEKPETLILLLRDQPQLQRALDQAGVPPDGRSVAFHIATAEAGTRYEVGSAPGATGTGSSGAGDASSGAFHQGGRPARDGFADADDTNADFALPVPPEWVRAGLDITA
jgi:flagellar hook-length control protein FliK